MATPFNLLLAFSLAFGATNGLSTFTCRRTFVQRGASGLVGLATGVSIRPPANADADADADAALAGSDLVVPPKSEVLVLGASGKTGRECVRNLLEAGHPCVATTRTGAFEYDGSTEGLSVDQADVTSFESVKKAIQGRKHLGAVIFAASASASGGDAFAVDRDGVVNAARVCIEFGVKRLVVVSSGTVTRPDSAVYMLLNVVGKGIMESKIQGEDIVREMYAAPDVLSKGLGYTIIRPGGLTTGQSIGASELELNQGDAKSGRISRADVAALCVTCLDSSDAFDTTFECYEKLTAKPIESVGFSNIIKSKDPTSFKTGKERQGDSFSSLFTGLIRDEGHFV